MKNTNSSKNYNVQMRIIGAKIEQFIQERLFITESLLYFKNKSFSLSILKNK